MVNNGHDSAKEVEGDIVMDVIPSFPPGHDRLVISQETLYSLLEQAAQAAYEASERQRQYFQTTPDGLRDKTIRGYKPVPYEIALDQSTPLYSIERTGEEEWKGPEPSLLPDLIAARHFLAYPPPILQLHSGVSDNEPERSDVSTTEEGREQGD